jgi:hypothetical protein
MPRLFEPLLSAEREERASEPRSSKILAFVGIFLLWWILTALVYRHTQSNFLRAESGWYLFLSHSTPVVQHNTERNFWTTSFNGHYAPLALLAEYETAKLAGTHGSFWKWRQITVLALLATILFLFVRNSGCALQLSRLRASLSATGLTAILIFQGQMREFIAWPFMIMQLFWLLFTMISLLALVRMARDPAKTLWPWLAAGAAYASLHFLGLGIATVAATASALAGIWFGTRHRASSDASKLTVPLLGMIVLAALHGALMLKLSTAEAIIGSLPGWQPAPFVATSLGFIPNFALATLRALFSTGQPMPAAWQSTPHWLYGLAILLGFGCLITSAFFRFRREPTVRNRTRFILQTFASVSFLTIIALISVRLWREQSPQGFADYLTGPRYLIPSTFALAGLIGELLFVLASAPLFLGGILNAGLTVYAIVGNLQYAASVYPKVQPRSMISHSNAWKSVVAMARECQRADLAIPNVPLGALTQEFEDWDLKLFEPLLRADLKIPPETNLPFIAWTGRIHDLPAEYRRDVPSLAKVQKTVGLGTRE